MERTFELDSDSLQEIFKGLYWELFNYQELNGSTGVVHVKMFEIDLREFKACNSEIQTSI